MTPRIVSAEILDHLPKHDPAALRSRRDLRRVHSVMGSRSIIKQALRSSRLASHDPEKVRVLELGAGDGSLMLGVARSLEVPWRNVELTFLDRIDLVDASTVERYEAVGWTVRPVVGDVLAWAAGEPKALPQARDRWDLIIANLFLHHFNSEELTVLMMAVEARADGFFACEPRRSWLAGAGSRLIGAIGVNAVTRADAVSSVRAGFQAGEISKLWPETQNRWKLREYSAGLFSHCFFAERLGVERSTESRANPV